MFQRDQVSRTGRYQWLKILAGVIVAILLFTGGAVVGFYRFFSRPSDNLIPPEEMDDFAGRINVLILGIDSGANGAGSTSPVGKRSDVMIVASIDPEMKEVGLLSIPRDTRAYIPGKIKNYEKIGHAHAHGGPELAMETVELLLGIPIHHYIRVNFEAFKKGVDMIGGVDMVIPENMDYVDPAQDLYIHIPKGPVHLDGELALQFVRYRSYVDGDIGRIKAQETFLKEVIKKALSLSNILKIPDIIQELLPHVSTSLSTQDLGYLADTCRKMDAGAVKMALVPGVAEYLLEGEYEVSYWIPDKDKTEDVVDELIRGISKERNSQVRVAVQNGCGITGAADTLAILLRDQGFQVVSVGNADKQDYETTEVLASDANRVAQALALRGAKATCPEAKAYKSKNVPEEADVLIIIGRDYKSPTASGGILNRVLSSAARARQKFSSVRRPRPGPDGIMEVEADRYT